MYTSYGDNILACQIAEEMIDLREGFVMENLNVLFNTLRNGLESFLEEMVPQRIAEEIGQVACIELPEYC